MRVLSPHILQRYDGNLGNPPAIKVASANLDVGYVRELIARYPRIPIIVRFIDEEFSWATPFASTHGWINRHAGQLEAIAAPNLLIEFLNEVAAGDAAGYAVASTTWLNWMHAHGYRCAWPSNSTGTYQYPDEGPTQAILRPVFGHMRPGDACSPHEYLGDNVDTATPDHILRFTKWPELLEHDLYIGECGSDKDPPGGQRGWRKTFGGNLDAYLAQLKRLDEVYQRFPQVKAAFVYSIGETQFGWDDFNLDWDRVVALQEEAPVTPRVGKPPFRLGPIFERWAGYPITTHHGEMIQPDPSKPAYAHVGTDFGCPEGTPLRAPFAALVDVCGWGGPNGDRGWYIWLLDTTHMVECLFCHLRESPKLERGDEVKAGEVFGYSGNTGASTGPHLHFRVAAVRDTADWPIVADYDPAGPDVLAT